MTITDDYSFGTLATFLDCLTDEECKDFCLCLGMTSGTVNELK